MSVFFFFKQKTAYEMRISDWSSDVCSSDLASSRVIAPFGHSGSQAAQLMQSSTIFIATRRSRPRKKASTVLWVQEPSHHRLRSDERRVGKDASVRVKLGGPRYIKEKYQQPTRTSNHTSFKLCLQQHN